MLDTLTSNFNEVIRCVYLKCKQGNYFFILTSVAEPGMELRSGKGLTSAKKVFDKHEERRKRMSLPATSNRMIERSSKRNRKSMGSNLVTSTNMDMQDSSRSSRSTTKKMVRKTLIEEFDNEQYMEKGMKEQQNSAIKDSNVEQLSSSLHGRRIELRNSNTLGRRLEQQNNRHIQRKNISHMYG